jgi:non-lysosomal glucosylceramidase
MECFDYPFYNTFDVSFYASYALLLLWPELEKQMMRDIARAVPQHDDSVVVIQSSGKRAIRKVAGAVPHDLGGPGDDPLVRVNWYRWQDINIWKDLNCKFVLQLWRDYVVTGDAGLVREAWPAAVQALDYLRQFDRDGDGLPEHDNVPDQTYDTWSMEGPSAYGGSLWLAALQAATALAGVVGATATGEGEKYAGWLRAGQAAFEAKLWNGRYYLYDGADNSHSDSIMADQLAGQWYADATGLEAIAPAAHVGKALRTVYDFNVQGFAGGQMGAVNGMRPSGAVDESSQHSAEVWTGTTYALAAFMLHRGMVAEAWATAWGVYYVTYNRGYWFRTPEAYDEAGNFRASLYMRPLSIWAMEHALRSGPRADLTPPAPNEGEEP